MSVLQAVSILSPLSSQELSILTGIHDRYTGMEIADKMCLSPKTVCTYRYRMYAKLVVRTDAAAAVLYARRLVGAGKSLVDVVPIC